MQATKTGDLASIYDAAPISGRYWRTFSLLAAGQALDFFDFFIVIFIVGAVAPSWHLTFGQSAIMLLGAGFGALIGALVWGVLADKWGRKPLIVIGTFICAFSSAALTIVPEGNWQLFAILRFGVGFGLAASATPTGALIVEYTPTRLRTFASSFIVVFNSVGVLLAATTAASLLTSLGWRGVAAFGVLPAVIGVLVWVFVPESYLWLLSAGRPAEARRAVAQALDVAPDSLPLPTAAPAPKQAAPLSELFVDPRRVILVGVTWLCASTAFYGVYLWGPTIISLLLKITPREAAQFFVYIGIVGVAGKALFSVLPQYLGRRRSGEIMGYCGAIFLLLTGYFHDAVLFGFPAFVVLLMAGDLFFEGGLANLAPYSVEVFGARLGARSVGLSQAANAIGKMAGPIVLALIAGTSNFVTPQATASSILPAFIFFALCSLVLGICFTLIPLETHGKPLQLDVAADPLAATGAPAAALALGTRPAKE
jgi:putative MFS transporter